MLTLIRIHQDTKKVLDCFKTRVGISYNDVVLKLFKDSEELKTLKENSVLIDSETLKKVHSGEIEIVSVMRYTPNQKVDSPYQVKELTEKLKVSEDKQKLGIE